MTTASHGRTLGRSTTLLIRFVLLFGAFFTLLYIFLDGTGPIAALNAAIADLTSLQNVLGGIVLRLFGEEITVTPTAIIGPEFSCQVETGCNGMSAVCLLVAGILSFPASWRMRGLGLSTLVPGILAVNVLRIAGLYLAGAHVPEWFGAAHVYVGQAVVITVAVALWLGWLSWSDRKPAVSR